MDKEDVTLTPADVLELKKAIFPLQPKGSYAEYFDMQSAPAPDEPLPVELL